MWADAVSGAKASRAAAAAQIPILFIIHLSVVGCFLFRVPSAGRATISLIMSEYPRRQPVHRVQIGTRRVSQLHSPAQTALIYVKSDSPCHWWIARMSAFGYKRTCGGVRQRVRFTPVSRHSDVQKRLALNKQTLDVRFAPKSGHKWLWHGMSAYDPKRTLTTLGAYPNKSQF